MKKVLTIAGSDSSGGAGIQADLKTIGAFGCFGMSVITALTAQNTIGVQGIFEVTPEFVKQQIDSVFTDIRPDAVKIGMLSNPGIVRAVAEGLQKHRVKNIVLDPVMVSTSGSNLASDESVHVLKNELFPLVEVITPNLAEAKVLSGIEICSKKDVEEAAVKIANHHAVAVLIKGGHLLGDADDLICYDGKLIWLPGERIINANTHGTGCTLSSAIACGLAQEAGIEKSIRNAKRYVAGAIADGLNLGAGRGPLNHFYKNHPEKNVESSKKDRNLL